MPQTAVALDWRRPVGEPGDLADVIVGILSLAKVEHGLEKLSRPDLYQLFSELRTEYPAMFPPMAFTRTGRCVYCKTLGDALERAIRLGLDVMNPGFYYLGIKESEDAQRNLELIQGNAGQEFLDALRPIAARLAELAASAQRRPAPTSLQEEAK